MGSEAGVINVTGASSTMFKEGDSPFVILGIEIVGSTFGLGLQKPAVYRFGFLASCCRKCYKRSLHQ